MSPLSDKKWFFGLRQDGLGGRLISLILTINEASKLGREYRYIWIENGACGASFDSLFERKRNLKTLTRISEIEQFRNSQIGYLGQRRNFICSSMPELRAAIKADKRRKIRISSNLQHSSKETTLLCPLIVSKPYLERQYTSDELDTSMFWKVLAPQKDIIKAKNEFLHDVVGGNNEHLIAVHIRRGDIITKQRHDKYVRLSRHVEKMKKSIVDNKRTRFFISSDCPSTTEDLHRIFPGSIYSRTKRSHERDSDGVREALIDLLIMSECRSIQGGSSQFCRAASIIGDTPLHRLETGQ